MKDFMAEEVETDANSPDKRFTLSRNRPSPSLPHNLHDSHAARNSKLSLTEQSLYSRGIVREVMRTRNALPMQTSTKLSSTTSTASIMTLPSTPLPNPTSQLNSSFSPFRPRTSFILRSARPKVHLSARSPSHQQCNVGQATTNPLHQS